MLDLSHTLARAFKQNFLDGSTYVLPTARLWHLQPSCLSVLSCSLHCLVAPINFYIVKLITFSSLFHFHFSFVQERLPIGTVQSTVLMFFLFLIILNILFFPLTRSRSSPLLTLFVYLIFLFHPPLHRHLENLLRFSVDV